MYGFPPHPSNPISIFLHMPPTPTVNLDLAIQDTTAALDSSEEYRESKGEKFLNAAGSLAYYFTRKEDCLLSRRFADNAYQSISGLSNNGYVTATSGAVPARMTLFQPELDSFKTGCDILMKTPDAVAKVHPFVTGAVANLESWTNQLTSIHSGCPGVQNRSDVRNDTATKRQEDRGSARQHEGFYGRHRTVRRDFIDASPMPSDLLAQLCATWPKTTVVLTA